LFSWFGYRLPLEQRLALAAGAGFDTVSLWLGQEEELVASGHWEALPALARSAGLAVDHAHAPFPDCNRLWSTEPEFVAAWAGEHERQLEFCHEHGLPLLVVHAVEDPCPPFHRSGVDAAGRLAERALQLGVTLAIENTCSAECIGVLLEAIPSRGLGLCYDSSHDFLRGQTRGSLLENWGHRLVTTHLSDNLGVTDDHFLPGEGQVDWLHLAEVFPRDSYRGAFLFELLPRPSGDGSAADFVRAACGRALRVRQVLGGTG
jgi:sugar phosphate isomerase/epimerase